MAAPPLNRSGEPDDPGVPRPFGESARPRPTSLVQWLRERSDDELARLLTLRPDLALPAPHDLSALAGRLGVRTSVQSAVDRLDAPSLAVLEALVVAAGDDDTVVDHPEPDPHGFQALLDQVLVWGRPDLIHLAPNVRESLGSYPGGLGRPAALLLRHVSDALLVPVLARLGIAPAAQPRSGGAVAALITDPERLAALLDTLGDDERDILRRLSAGPPVGQVRSVRPADDSPAGRLMLSGLLVPIDSTRVELPREVGLAVRAATDRAPATEPPEIRLVERTPVQLDELGTTAVREFLRLVDALAASWTAQPPPLLRSGGVGVRELRRTARTLDVEESTAALIAEVAHAAGLVNATSGIEPAYLPTTDYDAWAERPAETRWISLAVAWLTMTRQPNLVNQRGERDRVISALGPDVERGTVPALRRQVLDVLLELPPGAGPADRADVLALLAWRAPRRASGQRSVVETILAEADLIGLTAAGGATGWLRTLLAGSAGPVPASGATAAAEHALAHALPPSVDHFLVQPDLTVVVPGPPDRVIAAELGVLAELESTGGASVYRITERTVRNALDAGRSATEVAQFLAQRSRTPVPQSLDYLIDDAARRHGVLRAGVAASYVRCEDVALLARVVADRASDVLGLRLLAPTVAIADAPIARVLDALREAGYAPAAEGADGSVVTLDVEPARSHPRPPARVSSARGVSDAAAQAMGVVRRIRQGDEAVTRGASVHPVAATVPGVTSAATMELLRKAIREERGVLLGYADPDGTTSAHVLHPYSLAAGSVRGTERDREGLASYPVHRVTSVRLLEDDELAADPDEPGR